MEMINIYSWFWPVLFVLSLIGALMYQRKGQQNELKAQFVVTGCFIFVVYAVCFVSGVCTILNFLWNWVL